MGCFSLKIVMLSSFDSGLFFETEPLPGAFLSHLFAKRIAYV